MATKFSDDFDDIPLVEFLSNFSLPVSLGDLKELFENEVHFVNTIDAAYLTFVSIDLYTLESHSDGSVAVTA